jgi:hypothetical protein
MGISSSLSFLVFTYARDSSILNHGSAQAAVGGSDSRTLRATDNIERVDSESSHMLTQSCEMLPGALEEMVWLPEVTIQYLFASN